MNIAVLCLVLIWGTFGGALQAAQTVPSNANPTPNVTATTTPFTMMSYQLVPYANSELSLGLSSYSDGSTTDGQIAGNNNQSYSFSSSNDFGFAPSVTYLCQATDRDKDLTLDIPLNPDWYGYKSNFQTQDSLSGFYSYGTSNDYFRGDLEPNYSETWYRNNLQFGVQANLNLTVQSMDSVNTQAAQNSYQNYNYNSNSNDSQWNAACHMEARVGAGRLVETRWAWNALETVRVLKDHGVLLRPLYPDELQELAGLLAQLGSEYSWDFREQSIHDTRILWDYLAGIGCVAPNNPDAVVILSDTYLLWNSTRLRGGDIVAIAELDDQAALLTGSNVDPPNSPYGIPDYFQRAAFDPAPGAGLQCDWSRPLDRLWQFDAGERVDYHPYQDESANGERESTIQGFMDTGTVDLEFFPNERLSMILGDSIAWNSSRIENWSALSGGLLMDRYDGSYFQNAVTLALNCQFTYSFSIGLAAFWNYSLQFQQNGVLTGYDGASPNPLSGWPYQENSNYNLDFSVNYRLF